MGDAVQLRDCGTWLSGGTPSTEVPAFWNGEIPWITSSSLRGRYLSTSARRLTPAGVAAGSRLVPAGTLLFVVRGMSLKSEFRVGLATREVAFGQDCKALVPRAGVDPRFLLFALEAAEPHVLKLVDEASHGTGRLQTSLLSAVAIRLPSLEEQRRIAEVLDTIDDAIRSTERIIAKRRLMLRGLQRELLSTGSPTIVRDLIADHWAGEWGEGSRGADLTEVLVVRATNLTDRGVDLTTAARRWVSASKARSKRLHDGDIILESSGGGPGVPVGRVARFKQAGTDIYLTSNFFRALRPRSSVDPSYLTWLLDWEYRRPSIWESQQQTTGLINLQLNHYLGRAVRFDASRQSAIGAALDTAGRAIDSMRAELDKLRATRAGLAADLLSGRVRTIAS